MECNFAIALPYNLDFKIDKLEHNSASRQFKYYWRLLQAVLEDAQELLEEASRLLKLTAQDYKVLGGLVGNTPRAYMEEYKLIP
jgi:hypothetical protein